MERTARERDQGLEIGEDEVRCEGSQRHASYEGECSLVDCDYREGVAA